MATLGQRIKAAQVQAGVPSVEELADLPGRPDKFGAKTIGRVIRGERDLQPHEADWLSRVLHVEPGYFFTDPPPTGTQLDRVEQRLDVIEGRLQAIEAALRKLAGDPEGFDPAQVEAVLRSLQRQGLLRDNVLTG